MSDSVDQIVELQEEIRVSDKILKSWCEVLEAIPPCPAHGSLCVPHALEWIAAAKAAMGVTDEEGEVDQTLSTHRTR